MKFPTYYSPLLIVSFLLLFVQCKLDNYAPIESQMEELSNNFLDLSLNNNPLYDLYGANELTMLEGIQTGSNFDKSDYIRCKRYCEEDFDDCEKRARRSGLTIFGIVMLVGIGIALYTRRASILLGALFLGFLFGIMNYGVDSKYCKVILERELIRCEEQYLQQ